MCFIVDGLIDCWLLWICCWLFVSCFRFCLFVWLFGWFGIVVCLLFTSVCFVGFGLVNSVALLSLLFECVVL